MTRPDFTMSPLRGADDPLRGLPLAASYYLSRAHLSDAEFWRRLDVVQSLEARGMIRTADPVPFGWSAGMVARITRP